LPTAPEPAPVVAHLRAPDPACAGWSTRSA